MNDMHRCARLVRAIETGAVLLGTQTFPKLALAGRVQAATRTNTDATVRVDNEIDFCPFCGMALDGPGGKP